MLRRSTFRFLCVLSLTGLLCGRGVSVVSAQGSDPSEAARRYEQVVMEVLTERLASEVTLQQGQVALKTPASRTLKDMRRIVQASVPYYLEGALVEFKRFRPRVKEALAALDGWQIPETPRGWEQEEWSYFQVQGALENVLLLVALDMGVFSNKALAQGVRARAELDNDWTQIRGGSDPLDTKPLPDFGGPGGDNSTLDGLGGANNGGAAGSSEADNEALVEALMNLTARIDALERRSGNGPARNPTGGFPSAGTDGQWMPGRPATGLPDRMPESLTIQFPSGSAALGLSAEYGLNTLVEWMVARPDMRLLVTGHSDATGSERANMELSRRRAQVVRYYLLERGIANERVTAVHFGELRPEWGGGFDRRVELRLLTD
jgi:outer membrane protein OmpA-like peptidoglycan-associated protein